MKVQELRQLLGASDRENLEKALVETYKQLRKGQKEEFDPLLTDILQGRAAEKKAAEEAVKAVSFEELEWRFMVKNFI